MAIINTNELDVLFFGVRRTSELKKVATAKIIFAFIVEANFSDPVNMF
jgi:hypothetical protein